MNQQRSRRFRAAQDEEIKRKDEERIRKELEDAGHVFTEALDKKSHFDSNCITPGTPFMDRLSLCLKYYIVERFKTNPGWKDLKVVLSDASIPGEGEHKIMDYIRRQRNQPSYDVNSSHVLYGLDADLIMLALATHEPHFRILREDVFFQEGFKKNCFICGQAGHLAEECTGTAKAALGSADEHKNDALQPYVLLHVNILREYLEAELRVQTPFKWNIERALDDWVFLCFFVGNDFLPHLPSLEIREGAIDQLIQIWKRHVTHWDSYLTDSGDIDLNKVEDIMADLGKIEDSTFRKRREIEEKKRLNRIRRKQERKSRSENQKRFNAFPRDNGEPEILKRSAEIAAYPVNGLSKQERGATNREAVAAKAKKAGSLSENKAAADALRNLLSKPNNQTKESPSEIQVGEKRRLSDAEDELDESSPSKRRAATDERKAVGVDSPSESQPSPVVEDSASKEQNDDDVANDDDEDDDDDLVVESMTVADVAPVITMSKKEDVDSDADPEDNIRLWETGWKERYYRNKFHVELDDLNFRKEVVRSYIEGLCWVLKYYYQGVQSWKWFYPYHYAPFASDCVGISDFTVTFELGQPFKPVEQLMAVFPAASKVHIPAVLHNLMEDPDSSIIDFYPVNFPIDMNGKMRAWQGVALLPFIDEKRLLEVIEPFYSQFDQDEMRRNTLGDELLFIGSSSAFFDDMCSLYSRGNASIAIDIDPKKSNGLFGTVKLDPDVSFPGTTFMSPLSHLGCDDVTSHDSISSIYVMPVYGKRYRFLAQLLDGVKLPTQALTLHDREAVLMGYNANRNNGHNNNRGFSNNDLRFNNNNSAGRFNNPASANRGGYVQQQTHSNYSNDQMAYQHSGQPRNTGYNSSPRSQHDSGNYRGQRGETVYRGSSRGGYSNNSRGGGNRSYDGNSRSGYKSSGNQYQSQSYSSRSDSRYERRSPPSRGGYRPNYSSQNNSGYGVVSEPYAGGYSANTTMPGNQYRQGNMNAPNSGYYNSYPQQQQMSQSGYQQSQQPYGITPSYNNNPQMYQQQQASMYQQGANESSLKAYDLLNQLSAYSNTPSYSSPYGQQYQQAPYGVNSGFQPQPVAQGGVPVTSTPYGTTPNSDGSNHYIGQQGQPRPTYPRGNLGWNRNVSNGRK